MCRNITPLRGLEPVATLDEIEAAALQFVAAPRLAAPETDPHG
jgi:hypothetical protein